jgi:hypothetical protein
MRDRRQMYCIQEVMTSASVLSKDPQGSFHSNWPTTKPPISNFKHNHAAHTLDIPCLFRSRV